MLDFSVLPSWLAGVLRVCMDWLLAPVHAGPPDDVNQADFWHGVLMAVGGGVLVPLSVLAARYWKIVPGQDWPRVINHRGWQIVHHAGGALALLCLVTGVTLVFQGMSLASHLNHPHAWAGWGVMTLVLLLVLNTALRGSIGGPGRRQARTLVHLHDVPGDFYDMTLRRRIFEWGHRLLGWGLVFALLGTVLTGYWHVNVNRWVLLLTALWWLLLAVLALRWERQGRAVDGYQARWGPSMGHPGNRIPLLGGWHRRYSEEEYTRLPWGGGLIRQRRKRTARQRRAARLQAAADRRAQAAAQVLEEARQVSLSDTVVAADGVVMAAQEGSAEWAELSSWPETITILEVTDGAVVTRGLKVLSGDEGGGVDGERSVAPAGELTAGGRRAGAGRRRRTRLHKASVRREGGRRPPSTSGGR